MGVPQSPSVQRNLERLGADEGRLAVLHLERGQNGLAPVDQVVGDVEDFGGAAMAIEPLHCHFHPRHAVAGDQDELAGVGHGDFGQGGGTFFRAHQHQLVQFRHLGQTLRQARVVVVAELGLRHLLETIQAVGCRALVGLEVAQAGLVLDQQRDASTFEHAFGSADRTRKWRRDGRFNLCGLAQDLTTPPGAVCAFGREDVVLVFLVSC